VVHRVFHQRLQQQRRQVQGTQAVVHIPFDPQPIAEAQGFDIQV
jgi:hypothetical protein